MPRRPRILSSSGIYHVTIRGVNKVDIFHDRRDRLRFLHVLELVAEKGEYLLHAYCLMSNHVHLLFQEHRDSMAKSMKRIGIRYVGYFNKKYQRSGHLFENRYKSKPIISENYLLNCLHYIHQNPVEAGLCSTPEDYKWSSYSCYLRPGSNPLVTTSFVLDLFSLTKVKAVNLFKEFSLQPPDPVLSEFERRVNIAALIAHRYKLSRLDQVKSIKPLSLRNQIILEIASETQLSLRELEQILEISKSTLGRVIASK